MAAVVQRPRDRRAWSARCSTSSASGARSARRSPAGRRASARSRRRASLVVLGILVGDQLPGTRHNKRWDLTAARSSRCRTRPRRSLQDLKEAGQIRVFDADRGVSSASAIGSTSTRTSSKQVTGRVHRSEKRPGVAQQYERHGARHGRLRLQGPHREGHLGRRAGADQRADQGDPGQAAARSTSSQGHGEKDTAARDRDGFNGDHRRARRPTTSSRQDRAGAAARCRPTPTCWSSRGRRPISSPPEIDCSRRISRSGGKLLVMLDPPVEAGCSRSSPNLMALLKDWGIDAGNDIVARRQRHGPADRHRRVGAGRRHYPAHAITEQLQPADGLSAGAVDVAGRAAARTAATRRS